MTRGYLTILSGYIGWGLFPLYWALLSHVPAGEVLLHRMLWSVPVLLLLVLLVGRRRQQVVSALQSLATLKWLMLSAMLITLNWGVYIWAVNNNQVIEASMGYFLTPLLNVIAGVIFLREKLARLDLIAILFAAAGVSYLIITSDQIPWVGLIVAVSFSAYGITRKTMAVDAVPGLFIETLLLLPFTLAVMIWLHSAGTALFLNLDWNTNLWLILGGPVTVIPLAFFTAGARLLPLSTSGILFYVTPSLQFLSGYLLLGEAVDGNRLIGFCGIWLGLAVFAISLVKKEKATIAARQGAAI